jgi:hypothetical protein
MEESADPACAQCVHMENVECRIDTLSSLGLWATLISLVVSFVTSVIVFNNAQ